MNDSILYEMLQIYFNAVREEIEIATAVRSCDEKNTAKNRIRINK